MRLTRVGPLALCLGLVGWVGVGELEERATLQAMVETSNAFLASLTAPQRETATFTFEDDDRLRHHFIPVETFARNGLLLKELNPAQRERVQAMLRASLSTRGAGTVNGILLGEGLLPAIEGPDRQFRRDNEEYFISVFGTPSTTGTWGWRFEGHHISLHFTIVAGNLTVSTPTFLAASPARVVRGPNAGHQPLMVQEESARFLLASLTPEQRAITIFQAAAPRDIMTGAAVTAQRQTDIGVRGSAMTAPQRELLMAIIEGYIGVMNDDIARLRMNRVLADGLDDVTFAWAGGTERGQLAYYRVQGPSFLIEFSNTMNDPNHIHTTFRDFAGDMGRDLLAEHVQQDH